MVSTLAQAANEALEKECPAVFTMLSARGKRFFFPAKGILAQSGEAKQKAKTANATIGIATENGLPVHLACVNRYFQGLTPAEIFDYAPSYGKPDIRTAWAKKQRDETPSLGNHPLSNPVVTNALTHGLGLVGDLFLDPGDAVLTPDLLWENYNLNWETRLEATFHYFPFFDDALRFTITGLTPPDISMRRGGPARYTRALSDLNGTYDITVVRTGQKGGNVHRENQWTLHRASARTSPVVRPGHDFEY